jgi:cellulose synthase (UDP-forming)
MAHTERRPFDANIAPHGYLILVAATCITLALMAGYMVTRVMSVMWSTGWRVTDAIMAAMLIAAEAFMAVHGVGYFFNLVKCARRQRQTDPIFFPEMVWPPVSILVASFNESEDVLEDTLASAAAMDYPALQFYLLDDSTKAECQEGARRVAERYGFTYVHRTNRAGYKAGAINDLLPSITTPYIALLDADQKPLSTWLKEVMPFMHGNPRHALVQSPQVYMNHVGLPVAEAAKYQQAVWFEYICEGKSQSNAVFCCGSNCVLRVEALRDIETDHGGRRAFFDESSVTEDYATTYRLHQKGWRSDYVNQMYASGMGPETLPAYFVQQMRWAMGTMAQSWPFFRDLWRNPRSLTWQQWWEYFISCTYYFVGFANFTFMLAPMCFVFLDIRPLRTDARTYLYFFVPYMIFTMNLFFIGMKMRGFAGRKLWLASALSFCTFWIYMKAGMVAVFKLKRAFGVTPKGVGGAIPLRRLWMEFSMLVLNGATAIAGVYLFLHGWHLVYLINSVWAGYHTLLLSTLFLHFNRPVTIGARTPCFTALRYEPDRAA